MSEEQLSIKDVEYGINTSGLSPRSHVHADQDGILVNIRIPLSIGGVRISSWASSDIRLCIGHSIKKIVWEGEEDAGKWRLIFFGDKIRVIVGAGATLPEGHDVNSVIHYPLIHQGNDEGAAEGVYRECVSGSEFDLTSVLRTFSWMFSDGVNELLRHGPGHEIIHVTSQKVYEDLFPYLVQEFPWTDPFFLPYPLKDVHGWVARSIKEG